MKLSIEPSAAPARWARGPATEHPAPRGPLALRLGGYEELQPGREIWSDTHVVDTATGQVAWRSRSPSRLVSAYEPWSSDAQRVVVVGDSSFVLTLATGEERALGGGLVFRALYSPTLDRLLCQSHVTRLFDAVGDLVGEVAEGQLLGWTRHDRFLLGDATGCKVWVHDGRTGARLQTLELDPLALFPVDARTRASLEGSPRTVTSPLGPRAARDLFTRLSLYVEHGTGELFAAAVRLHDGVADPGTDGPLRGVAEWVRIRLDEDASSDNAS